MDPTEPSILMLTKSCISKFEELIDLHGPRRIELENRLADFNLWADGVGALSKPGSSLDSRLQGRVNDLALVKNVLGTLADSLDYYKDVAKIESSSYEGIQTLDSTIKNLALIGVAIRRTGKASRHRKADRTFNQDEHQEFRAHLECIILLRPTQEGLFHQTEIGGYAAELDHSKLTPLQHRLITANLKRRHNFRVAQKRSKHQRETYGQLSTPTIPFTANDSLQGPPLLNAKRMVERSHLVDRDTKRIAPTIAGFSLASTAEGTLRDASVVRRYNPGLAKTQITSIASDAEFPQPPPISSDRQVAKCPCCCQSLPIYTFTDPQTWKQHIIEDLCPYTCVAENCPTPQLLFCTRNEWENHVRQNHLPRWQCPFCDEGDVDYPMIESMGSHIEVDHQEELVKNSLATLLSWSAVQVIGIESCPLCASCGPEDSTELIDHVLQHTYEFALRALPWPPPATHNLNIQPGSFSLPENLEHAGDIQHWIDEAAHAGEGVPGLALCSYDAADHSTPTLTNISEYNDYYLTNEYFNESHRDNSSRPQSCPTVDSNLSAVSVESLISAKSVNTSAPLQMLEGHTEWVRSVTFSPDGKTIASASGDFTVRLWSVATGEQLQRLKGHTGAVMTVTFSPDGSFVISGSRDYRIMCWSTDTGSLQMSLRGHNDVVNSIAYSPDQALIVSGSSDSTARVWSALTGEQERVLEGHTNGVTVVAFSHDGNLIASGSDDCNVQVWSVDSGLCLYTIYGHAGSILSVAFSLDNQNIRTRSCDGTSKLWSCDTGTNLRTFDGYTDSSTFAISSNSQIVALGLDDYTIQLQAAHAGKHLKTLKGHTNVVISVAFSPDDTMIVSGSYDKTVCIWSVDTST